MASLADHQDKPQPTENAVHMWNTYLICLNLGMGSESLHSFGSNFGFALSHMMLPEQELPVEIAGLDCIHVNLCSHRQ